MEEQTKTVLIVEDDDDLRELIVEFLNDDYLPVVANTADDAVDLARCTRPAIIVCDFNMPGKNGLHAIRELRGDPALAKIPVILMSGQEQPAECTSQSNVTFLPKPFDMPKLIEVITGAFARAIALPT